VILDLVLIGLAITLEPAGGSKTGLPTGPVVYSGPIMQFF